MAKASNIILGILAVIVIIAVAVVLYFVGIYNEMVAKDEGVKTAWSQVENQYQRRADLIQNLVNTVQGYADFESETLEAVINARSKATQTQVNVNDSSAFAQFQQNQDSLTAALGKLLVVVEQYPELKANQSFLELQAQLEGTENRLSVARKNFNETVKEYNIYIRQLPKNFVAGMFNFKAANLFENQAGTEVVPVVEFN